MFNGYFSLPRIIYQLPAWIGAKLKYRALFHEIACRVVWKEQEYNANGHTISLIPGQYCSSIRRMVTDFNPEGLRGKASEDTFSKNDIEAGIQYFLYHGLLRQEIRHDTTVLTLCLSGLCEEFDKLNQTDNQTKIRQKSDTKEESKKEIRENKEKYKKEKILKISENKEIFSEAVIAVNQDFQSQPNITCIVGKSPKKYPKSSIHRVKKELSKEDERIDVREWVKITLKEHQTLISKYGNDFTNSMLDILDAYNTSRQQNYKSDYGAMKEGGWVFQKASEQSKKVNNSSDSNVEYAKECVKKFSEKVIKRGYNLNLGNDYIEFSPNGGNAKVFHLKFQENGFRDQLDSFLRKLV